MKRKILLSVLFIAHFFIAKAQVQANFTANPVSGCSPLIVHFTDLSSGNITNWHWDFGNGATSDTVAPVVTYVTPGSYDVKLVVSDGVSSDSLIISGYITVFNPPQSYFSANPLSGCPPLLVSFTDNSQAGDAPVNSWLWDFGDGNISALKNPSHSYAYPSQFTVSLQVSDLNGCSDVYQVPAYVKVNDIPSPDFQVTDWFACSAPFSTSFQNLSTGTGSLSYDWDFGDGGTSNLKNPSHTFAAIGSYDITLVVTDANGCTNSIVKKKAVSIQNYNTSMTVDKHHACIRPQKDTFFFSDMSSPNRISSYWNFGDGNTSGKKSPKHIYQNPGVYIVQLVTSNPGCSDTLWDTVYVQEIQAAFYPDSSYTCNLPGIVNFIDSSVNALSWHWEFGDSSAISTGSNPIHSYGQAGIYLAKLFISNQYGCTDSVFHEITVDPIRGDLTTDKTKGCIPLTVNFFFANKSFRPVSTWFWDFRDGTTSNNMAPMHIFDSVGVYWVKFTASNNLGCTFTDSIRIEAGIPPTGDFSKTKDTLCAGELVTLLPITNFADDYIWDFGDNRPANPSSPAHIYKDTGWFTVTMTPLFHGCPGDSVMKLHYLYVKGPTAFPNIDTILCSEPLKVFFRANAILAKTYKWYFGDGDSSMLINPVHIYPGSGDYTATLYVSNDSTACTFHDAIDVHIRQAQAVFSMSDSFACKELLQVTFDASASKDVFLFKYYWDFGNGDLLNPDLATDYNELIFPPPEDYTNPGLYTVSLTVYDMLGCSNTMTKKIYVAEHVTIIDASDSAGCAPFPVSFADSSHIDSTILVRQWDFGDGFGTILMNPQHTYSMKGKYWVTLHTIDAAGCEDIDSLLVTVADPKAGFYTNDTAICADDLIQIINTSPDSALTFKWDFGDGTSSTAKNPVHAFSKKGAYTIRLIVIDTIGCSDTIIKSNYIRVSKPVAGFFASDTMANCPPALIQFTSNNDTSVAGWAWDFGDGSSSQLQNPLHNFTLPGSYNVSLIVSDFAGCTDTIYKMNAITVAGPTASFDFMPKSGCFPLEVNFWVDSLNQVGDVFWDFGDGTTLMGDTVTHTYDTFGVFWPVLVINNGLQGNQKCEYGIPSAFPILLDTILADFSLNPDHACVPADIIVNDKSLGDLSNYLWTLPNGNTVNAKNLPAQYFDSAGTYWINLEVTNVHGCKHNTQKKLEIYPLPEVSVMGDTTICPGDTAWLSAAEHPSYLYLWSPALLCLDANSSSTGVIPVQNTGFKLQVTDTNACQFFSDSIWVILAEKPLFYVYPDTSIFAGDTIQLHVSLNNTLYQYNWSPPADLSCANCPETNAYPLETTLFTLTTTDSLNCFDLSASLTVEVLDGVRIAVPEAFTPNGDGVNDIVRLRLKGQYTQLDFSIYNRWGELIFSSNDENIGWDGTYKGKLQSPDSYAWSVAVKTIAGHIIRQRGSISLLP